MQVNMDLPDLLLALHAVKEGALERTELPRLFGILDSWSRGGLQVSCGEVLAREFRIDAATVRRWEAQLSGQTHRRIGKYVLRRRVGQGGMGIVFEAEDPNLDHAVALKILSPALGRDPSAIQGFLREVKSAGRFNHPNIVHAYDAGIDGDLPYLAMEFIDGENLFQILQREGPLPSLRVAGWLLQASRALAVLEGAGWIHGDGKPSNWILDQHGTLKLADLGLCRPPGKPRKGETLYGSPPYTAPEALSGKERIDVRADLYSLGATFFHLLTGRPPYTARAVEDLRREQEAAPAPSVKAVRGDVDDALAELIDRLLARDPAARFANCAELIAAIEAKCAGRDPAQVLEPGDAVTLAPPEEIPRAARPMRRVLVAGILLVVVGICAAAWLHLRSTARDASDDVQSGAARVAPDTESPPDGAMPDALGAEWRKNFEAIPRDYPALLFWLDTRAVDHTRYQAWTEEVHAALAKDAEPLLIRLAADVNAACDARRFVDAIALLDAWPSRLRAGRAAVEHEKLVHAVLGKREVRFQNLFDPVQRSLAARDFLGAWRSFARSGAEPAAADRAWYRDRIVAAAGGTPWIDAVVGDALQEITARRAREESLRRELRAGRIPAPGGAAGDGALVEAALAFLGTHPELVTGQGSLRERLFAGGFFSSEPPFLLASVAALLEDDTSPAGRAVPIHDECRGARLFAAAQAACDRWEVAPAIAAWDELAQDAALAGTVAAQHAVRARSGQEGDLRAGAFLRSGAFVAKVHGELDSAPRFEYSISDALFREWRCTPSQWEIKHEFLTPISTQPTPLECMIPFEPAVEMEIEVKVPEGGWFLFITYADSTLGIGRRQLGELLVMSGPFEAVRDGLLAGSGFWQAGHTALTSDKFTLRARFDAEELTVALGPAQLAFPLLEEPAVGWVELRLHAGLALHSIAITARPNRVWLQARQELLSR